MKVKLSEYSDIPENFCAVRFCLVIIENGAS